MTPYQHYLEAERLLAEYTTKKHHPGYVITPPVLTMAQVHATLACANQFATTRADDAAYFAAEKKDA